MRVAGKGNFFQAIQPDFHEMMEAGEFDVVNSSPSGREIIMESSILAQNERWRRVLSMQVERDWRACPPRERRTGE